MTSKLPVLTPLQKHALSLVRREMHLYDAMASAPRLRTEYGVTRSAACQDITTRCGHDILLYESCAKCERSDIDVCHWDGGMTSFMTNDCAPYKRAMKARLERLCKML